MIDLSEYDLSNQAQAYERIECGYKSRAER